jgi:large repetitive protein
MASMIFSRNFVPILFFILPQAYFVARPLKSACHRASTLIVYAGGTQSVCHPGDSVKLGWSPTASGGVAPYTYSWTPTIGMNNSSLANPTVAIFNSTERFYLNVTDNVGDQAFDSVNVYIDSIYYASAGGRQNICGGTSVKLGGPYNLASFQYQWIPGDSLSCTNCPEPLSTPITEITYTMIITDPSNGCKDTSSVTITPIGPKISTTSPVTLTEGKNTNLQASGGVSYRWYPQLYMFEGNTSSPEVEPINTYTYYVAGYDGNGCAGFDSVVVIVNSDSDLVFYNTFTPNGDGINDSWYIGNIWQYPNNDLYIYNRYGKLVYFSHSYLNQWNGKNNDVLLPAATYYYVLDTGTGRTYRGSVTIIRIE